VAIVGEKDGVKLCIQIDHRSPKEMDYTPEISVLFALVRTLLPRRLAEEGEPTPRVRHAALAGASPAVRAAVAAAGAELESMESGDSAIVPYEGSAATPRELADDAFHALAERVARREGVTLSSQGLTTFEDRLREAGIDLDDEEQEIEAGTAVVELAALTGACLRDKFGGHWDLTEDVISADQGVRPSEFGMLPFVFVGAGGMIHNAANKAIRALSEPGQSAAQLLVELDDGSDGVTMVTLKPADWGMEGMVARPLLEGVPESPLAIICCDHPNTVAHSTVNDTPPEERDARFDEALENLAQIEVAIEKLDLDLDMDVYVVHGDFLRRREDPRPRLHDGAPRGTRTGARRGRRPGQGTHVRDARRAGAPTTSHASPHSLKACSRASPHPISPLVFAVMNGEVCGLLRPAESEPPPKKSFWKRLFH
jgi:hypothetical protein